MDKKKLEYYLRKFTSEDFSKEDYYSEYTSCLLQNLKEKSTITQKITKAFIANLILNLTRKARR
jgi:hypothetical protein